MCESCVIKAEEKKQEVKRSKNSHSVRVANEIANRFFNAGARISYSDFDWVYNQIEEAKNFSKKEDQIAGEINKI